MNNLKNHSEKNAAAQQIDRFKEAARQIDVDEDEAAFDKKLKALAKPISAPAKHEK